MARRRPQTGETFEGAVARLALFAIVLPILLKSVATLTMPAGDPALSALASSLCLTDPGSTGDRRSTDREPCCILCGLPGSAALPPDSPLPFTLAVLDHRSPAVLLAPTFGLQPTSLPGTLSLRGPPLPA